MGDINNFPILQIVGYKNSGKTTLVKKIIGELEKINLKYGVLKHHGHGGRPVLHDEGTDTWKYREAGASATAVEGEGFFQFTANVPEMPLETMLSFFQLLPLDGLILEGFKRADFPKIVLIRTEEDLALLEEITNIMAIIVWDQKVKLNTQTQPTQFFIYDDTNYLNYIVEWLKGALK